VAQDDNITDSWTTFLDYTTTAKKQTKKKKKRVGVESSHYLKVSKANGLQTLKQLKPRRG
jgi:hypothetical protein